MNSDPNSAQHSALQQVGRVHSAYALCALSRAHYSLSLRVGHLSLRARHLSLRSGCVRVATPPITWPCRDTSPMSRHQDPPPCPSSVATPIFGRNPKRPTHVATPISPNSVATSKRCRETTSAHSGAFRSRHHKLHRYNLVAPFCRDTKDCVATDLSSHASFVSRHRVSCPMLRHQKVCRGPTSAPYSFRVTMPQQLPLS